MNTNFSLQKQNVRSFESSSAHSYGAIAQKAFAATAPSSQTSSCFTSTESYPYESLDNEVQTPLGPPPSGLNENELTQSLPSCSTVLPPTFLLEEPASEMELSAVSRADPNYQMQLNLMHQHHQYQMVMQQQLMAAQQQQQQQNNLLTVTDAHGQRHLMR